MSEVQIPNAAAEMQRKVLTQWGRQPVGSDYDAMNAAAPIIVAAELRRMAKTPFEDGPWWALRDSLLRRADELDPPTGGETE